MPKGRWTHKSTSDQSLPNSPSWEPSSHNQEPDVPLGVKDKCPLISKGHYLPEVTSASQARTSTWAAPRACLGNNVQHPDSSKTDEQTRRLVCLLVTGEISFQGLGASTWGPSPRCWGEDAWEAYCIFGRCGRHRSQWGDGGSFSFRDQERELVSWLLGP